MWTRPIDFSFKGWLVASLFLSAVILAWIVVFAGSIRHAPLRCPEGMLDLEARCCAPGQGISGGRCVGAPEHCPPPYLTTNEGCIYPSRRILVPGGSTTLGPTDWDSADLVGRVTLSVKTLWMDEVEVDYHRYQECVSAGRCKQRAAPAEPGAPVSNITALDAAEFCRFAGGRLPTVAEWIFAATGIQARRFPWGAHGLVCRRASYGLTSGPCASEGSAPELPGTRPSGGTPEGLLDMAGNLAEWAVEPSGLPSVRGGSFRSKSAGELKTWASGEAQASDEVGFRCAYDQAAPYGDLR